MINFIENNREIADNIFKKLSELNVEIKANESNAFKVIMSKQVEDRDGEIVVIDGVSTERFMKNPVCLNSHNYWGIENIIGKFTNIYKSTIDGVPCLIGEGVFATGISEAGDLANALYQNGFLKSVSVGFIPLSRDEKNSYVITKSELLECSFVTVPANPEALDIMKGKGIDPEKVMKYFGEEKKELTVEEQMDLITFDGIEKGMSELDLTFKAFYKETNMGYQEHKNWSETECSTTGSSDMKNIVSNLLYKPKADWSNDDVLNAQKCITYIDRMKGLATLTDYTANAHCEKCGNKGYTSLKNCGYDMKKGDRKPSEDMGKVISDIAEIKELLKGKQAEIKADDNIEVKTDNLGEEIDKVFKSKKEIQSIVNSINDGLANLKTIRF